MWTHALKVVLALGVAVATTASPTPATGTRCVTTARQNVTFDELPAGVTPSPLPTPYKGLFWQSYNALTPAGGTTLPGLIPQSPPRIAGTTARSQLTAGTPMLTTNYPNSRTTSFDLYRFYFGCIATVGPQSATAVPFACTVNLTGYKGKDNQVAAATQVCAQSVSFKPKSSLQAAPLADSGQLMACFKGVNFITTTYSLTGTGAVLNADNGLFLDNVELATTSCS